jgi:hypothetical protein
VPITIPPCHVVNSKQIEGRSTSAASAPALRTYSSASYALDVACRRSPKVSTG